MGNTRRPPRAGLRRDLDQLLAEAEAEASATSASQPGADAGQDGEGWRDAQHFWGDA
jgi:transposase